MSPVDNFGTTFLEIASYIALSVGLVCILCLLFLFIRWIFGIRIMRHKTTEQKLVDIDYSLEVIAQKTSNLGNQLNILDKEITQLRQELKNGETTKIA